MKSHHIYHYITGNLLMFMVGLFVLSQFSSCVEAINCYECDSFDDFTCTEIWDPELDVNLSFLNNCSHVSGAKYCIKMTGIYQVCKALFWWLYMYYNHHILLVNTISKIKIYFQGKLGAKRLCSSKDWGNYCEYVKRPGDIQEYESCIFSCSSEECNSSDIIRPNISLAVTILFQCITYLYHKAV